jgi:hypothetical protein
MKNVTCNQYQDLRAKARKLGYEITDLEEQIKHPLNFAHNGEVRTSDVIGWNNETTWFYVPSWLKAELTQRQQAAVKKLEKRLAKRQRVLAKAKVIFDKLPWSDRAVLSMMEINPR